MRQPLDMPIPRGVAQRRAGPFSSGSILLAWKTRALFASSTQSTRRSLHAERRPWWQRGVVRSLPAHGVGCARSVACGVTASWARTPLAGLPGPTSDKVHVLPNPGRHVHKSGAERIGTSECVRLLSHHPPGGDTDGFLVFRSYWLSCVALDRYGWLFACAEARVHSFTCVMVCSRGRR